MQESCKSRSPALNREMWPWFVGMKFVSVNEVEMKSSSWVSSHSLQWSRRWVQHIAFCSLQATQIVPALFICACNQVYHQEAFLRHISLYFSAFGFIMPGLKLNGALILCVLMLPFSRPNSQVLDCREVRSSFQFLYPGMKWTPETPVSGKTSYSDLRLSIFLCELKSMSKKVSKHCLKVLPAV